MEYIDIYTDGACSQGAFEKWPGGWAIVAIPSNRNQVIISGGAEQTTNNEMELTAFLTALKFADFQSTMLKYDVVNIYTDSAYIHNCLKEKWYIKWRNNGWVNSAKEPVKNKELWEQIIKLVESIKTTLELNILKVKAHADNEYNNLVDRIAVEEKEKHVR